MDAYSEIKKNILRGVIPLGERLREEHLAATLNLSRTPIREAIRRLEAEGLLVYSTNRGVTVREFTYEDIQDSYALRAQIEGYAAQMAAENHDDTDLTILKHGLSLCQEAMHQIRRQRTLEHVEMMVEANQVFHNGVVSGAKNRVLKKTLQSIVVLPIIFNGFYWFTNDDISISVNHHQSIYSAIKQKDRDLARVLMAVHIYHGRDHVLANFNKSRLIEN